MLPTQLIKILDFSHELKKEEIQIQFFVVGKLTLFMQFACTVQIVSLKLFKTLSCRPGFCID